MSILFPMGFIALDKLLASIYKACSVVYTCMDNSTNNMYLTHDFIEKRLVNGLIR